MIQLENVTKIFGTGVAGVLDITLSVDNGEFIFLVGHTGSGKTTLLRLLIRDMVPTEGKIFVDELDIAKLPNHKIPQLRKKIGVIFQDLKLLTDRTIFENVLLPMQFSNLSSSESRTRAEELLDRVGVLSHRDKFPVQLSGGELQRVAIARALSLNPDVLLADEPTGNLDTETAFGIVDLLAAINKTGTTVIMATHNLDIIRKLPKRVITLDSGKLVKDSASANGDKKGSKESDEPKGPEVASSSAKATADKGDKEETEAKKNEVANNDKDIPDWDTPPEKKNDISEKQKEVKVEHVSAYDKIFRNKKEKDKETKKENKNS